MDLGRSGTDVVVGCVIDGCDDVGGGRADLVSECCEFIYIFNFRSQALCPSRWGQQ